MSGIGQLQKLPADPLLGIMAAYRADTRQGKVDLGVGVFKTADGHTPILPSVKAAETQLHQAETTKVYEGPQGNPIFGPAIARLVYGENAGALGEGRVTAFAVPGGCGGLGIGIGFLRRLNPEGTLWISAPSWPNHAHVADLAGFKTASYDYQADGAGGVAMNALTASLSGAKAGDTLLIQGPCHNPTGIDFSTEQWSALSALCQERSLFPMIDIAYHGFAYGLDEDLNGVQAFLAEVPEALISYSCSKNFGLYRERAGALLAQGATADLADTARTHIASIARGTYSMPPSHGAGIVATILDDPDLTAQWRSDVDEMRGRLITLRTGFADALEAAGHAGVAEALRHQNGMFSQLPIRSGGHDHLRETHGVYMPGSGRINIAGLPEHRLGDLARQVSEVL